MCGLVGVIGNINKWDRVAFHWLLHLDVIRGEDSTGVCAVHRDNTTHVYKELGRPENLYDLFPEQFKGDVYQEHNVKCLMGHNRHATQGAVNAENAHPFEFDRIIGAHNGTVWQWSMRDLSGYTEHDIDSKIIFQHINDSGSIQEVWDVADGAMALTWWDKQEKALNIVRNKERPLHYCVSKDRKTLYWASKPWMLEAALGHCRIKHDKIESFDTDKLHEITFSKQGDLHCEEIALDPFVDPWKRPQTVYQNPHVQAPGFLGSKSWPGYTLEIKEFVKEGPKDFHGYFVAVADDDEEMVVDISNPDDLVMKNRYEYVMDRCSGGDPFYSFSSIDVVDVKGYDTIKSIHLKPLASDKFAVVEIDGERLNVKQFEAKYKEGCCLCGTHVPFEKVKDSVFLSDLVICSECKDSAIVQDWLETHQDKRKVQ